MNCGSIADWVMAGVSIASAVVTGLMAYFTYKAAKASVDASKIASHAANIAANATDVSLKIARGDVPDNIDFSVAELPDGKLRFYILNRGNTKKIVTCCGFCFKDKYYLCRNARYHKSCFSFDSKSGTMVTIVPVNSNCPLDSGDYCVVDFDCLAFDDSHTEIKISEDEKSDLKNALNSGKCLAFCVVGFKLQTVLMTWSIKEIGYGTNIYGTFFCVFDSNSIIKQVFDN